MYSHSKAVWGLALIRVWRENKMGDLKNSLIDCGVKNYINEPDYSVNRDNRILSREEVVAGIHLMVARHPELKIARVDLFGSYARNEADGESDIDLCFAMGVFLDFKQRRIIQKEIYEILGKSCSLIDMFDNFNSVFFVRNVAREAVLIYENEANYKS